MAGPAISNDKIYEFIDRTRLELKGDIIRIETKFDSLEAGRISAIENDVKRLQIRQATATMKLAILGFIASAVVGSLVSALAMRFVVGLH